ncbi:hypothetical protein Nepgr_021218 [Nepenthes gracilis]|uniref:SelT-like protein n=1 Tax=Nepenthes gracilis TaxID=150966 RepID=A0AAD3XVR5_NEPGR|nr:hypothetical protein Nepgr_021218 [Nepenthes gracilis]
MDRVQLLLVGLPLFLFCTDVINLFGSRPPPKSTSHHHHHPVHRPQPHPSVQQTLDLHTEHRSNDLFGTGSVGVGHTVSIDFCSSCSYRGTAVSMKNMLENQFPGIHVMLANYPPSPPKRLLSKVAPVLQIGAIALIVAGDQIFPRLGVTPPPWYYSLRANRFGTISAIWLLGNFIQSSLQSSGAFEVSCDGELVFSKLKEQRFPGEIELRGLVGQTIAGSRIVDGAGENMWAKVHKKQPATKAQSIKETASAMDLKKLKKVGMSSIPKDAVTPQKRQKNKKKITSKAGPSMEAVAALDQPKKRAPSSWKGSDAKASDAMNAIAVKAEAVAVAAAPQSSEGTRNDVPLLRASHRLSTSLESTLRHLSRGA